MGHRIPGLKRETPPHLFLVSDPVHSSKGGVWFRSEVNNPALANGGLERGTQIIFFAA